MSIGLSYNSPSGRSSHGGVSATFPFVASTILKRTTDVFALTATFKERMKEKKEEGEEKGNEKEKKKAGGFGVFDEDEY